MTTFLILSAVAVLWVLSLLVHPFGRCPECRGRGNIIKPGSGRAPACPLCKGLKRRQRPGSRTVHRVRRQVARHWREPKP